MENVSSGWATAGERQRKLPSKQHSSDAGRSRVVVDGLDRVQRRRPVRRQRRRLTGGSEHARVHRHQPADVAHLRHRLLQKALRHRRRPRHDHRPRLHHPRRRSLPY